jgi:preprotein translocase subunit SecE
MADNIQEPPGLPIVPDSEAAPSEGQLATDTPAELGTTRYVHAALFASGVLAAFLIGKILDGVWNSLANTPWVVRQVPALVAVAEDERPTFTMTLGAVLGVCLVVLNYRREGVRNWANSVAGELAKVHWPERQAVANGTVVVVAASLFATVYVGLLDRFWGLLMTWVYGA